MRNSPFVEKLTAADYEVVYFTDPLDEYVMSNMPDFEDHRFQDVTKDDLKIGKDKAEKKREKKVKVRSVGTRWHIPWPGPLPAGLTGFSYRPLIAHSRCRNEW